MDSLSDPKIEKAWQDAVDYLHREMSRGWFDSWVKPAFLMGYKDGCFDIGCTSSYQRDWLADRLTSTVERFLTGTLNRSIQVRFVFNPCGAVDGPVIEEHQAPDEKEDDGISLDVLYSSMRDCLVEPDRVVRLPVYYLRWLPYVGAQTVFLAIALWQAYYLTHNGKSPKGAPKVSVRAEQICQWAGISRAQFFRLTQSGSAIGWFAQKSETNHEIDRRTGRAKKSANGYHLFNLPFTPGDAIDLTHFLLSHDFQNSPEDALRSAISIDPKLILQYPFRKPPADFIQVFPHRITVQETIKSLAGRRWNTEISDLADQLADRLTGQGEFILVSWYFLRNWLPRLGPNVAMLILILRNLCYFNDVTGEIRDEVWINDGYEGIADRLGISKPQLVSSWFPAAIEHKKSTGHLSERTSEEYNRRIGLQQLLGRFVRRTDHRINSAGSFAWKFKVERSDPLTPEDEALRSSISNLFAGSDAKGVTSELYAWIDQTFNHCFETVKNRSSVVLRLSSFTNDCSETLKTLLKDCFETLEQSPKRCPETLLKILKKIKDSQKDQDTSSNPDSQIGLSRQPDRTVGVAAINSNGNWSLEKLLARADQKNRQTLLSQEDCPTQFVSWVIYGVSQTCIQNPFSLAIAKLKENSRTGAGGAYERLAELHPECLANLITNGLSWRQPQNSDWRMVFSEISRDRIRLLADLLQIHLADQEDCMDI